MVCDVLLKWEIPDRKISAIVTNNGSNMIATFKEWVLQVRARENETDVEEVSCNFLQRKADLVRMMVVKTVSRRWRWTMTRRVLVKLQEIFTTRSCNTKLPSPS